MRVGSLCTGIAGLEHGLELAGVNVEPVFVSDIDEGSNAWLEANMPDIPNLGDFTALDALPPVDLLTAGFPCQPLSSAGQRKGVTDDRWIFDHIARLLGRGMANGRPFVFLENVPDLLTSTREGGDPMGRVVRRLAEVGYCIDWGCLPASAVGAPHRRNRWWGLAYPADPNDRRQFRRNPQRLLTCVERPHAARSCRVAWGPYERAIKRWESVVGRAAPEPQIDGRLSPAFTEWMMGYPRGWVTDTLPDRRQALHVLGNAVVPQCAAEAFTQLVERAGS